MDVHHGHRPFRAESPLSVLNRISRDEPTPLQQANSDLSKTLSDITDKLLQKDPDDRFQSAGELHEVLEQFLAYLHQPDVSKPPKIRAAEPSKYFSAASSVLLAVALVVAQLGAFGVGWFELPAMRRNFPDQNAASESQDGANMQSPQVHDAEEPVGLTGLQVSSTRLRRDRLKGKFSLSRRFAITRSRVEALHRPTWFSMRTQS